MTLDHEERQDLAERMAVWIVARADTRPAMLVGMCEVLTMLVRADVEFSSICVVRDYIWNLLTETGTLSFSREAQSVLAKLALALSEPADALRVVALLNQTPTPLRRQEKGWLFEVDFQVGSAGGSARLKSSRVGLLNRGCVYGCTRLMLLLTLAVQVNLLCQFGGPTLVPNCSVSRCLAECRRSSSHDASDDQDENCGVDVLVHSYE